MLGVYLLTMSGHTYSPDEETMLEVSRTLVTEGTWAISPSHALVEVTGADGRRYSQYGPGQPFAAVPWAALGLAVGQAFPKDQAGFPLRLILGSYNALIAAGICGLLAALGTALGYKRWASLFLGGTLAFATFLWPHSRTFFSEPLTALCLLAAFYLMRRARLHAWKGARGRDDLLMLGAGAFAALALATKIQYAVVLPAFVLYLLWPARKMGWGAARQRVRPALMWGAGFALGMLPLLLYNLSVFGSPFLTGYGTDLKGTFGTPLGEGLYGLLLSPGKGLVWYALPVLLALWGLRRFAVQHLAEAAFILLLGASTIGLFALYNFWHGDGSWGPRYLIPALPFLLLPALPVLQGNAKQGEATTEQNPPPATFRPSRLLISVIVALGVGVNLLGVLVNFDTYINSGYNDEERHFDLAASPIVGHFKLLTERLRPWELNIIQPTDTLVFKDGFSYSEGDKTKHELLPRWTTGEAVVQLWPDLAHGPAQVTLRLTDHRPPELPRAVPTILVNNNPAPVEPQPVPDVPISADYTFPVDTRPAIIVLRSSTWNPAKQGVNERDEDLGLKLESVTVMEGGQPHSYTMRDSPPAPPYYPQPRWYYNPATPRPADLWPVYMAETGMGRKAMLALGLPVALTALVCLTLGLRGLREE